MPYIHLLKDSITHLALDSIVFHITTQTQLLYKLIQIKNKISPTWFLLLEMTVTGLEREIIALEGKTWPLVAAGAVDVEIITFVLLFTIRVTIGLGVAERATVVFTIEGLFVIGLNEILRALLRSWEVSRDETTTKLDLFVVVLLFWPLTTTFGLIGIRCTIWAVLFVYGLDLNTI